MGETLLTSGNTSYNNSLKQKVKKTTGIVPDFSSFVSQYRMSCRAYCVKLLKMLIPAMITSMIDIHL